MGLVRTGVQTAILRTLFLLSRPNGVGPRQHFPCSGPKRKFRGRSYKAPVVILHAESFGMGLAIGKCRVPLMRSIW
jgi:hypothetical protein